MPNGKRKVKDLAPHLLDMVEILQTQDTAVDLMLCNMRPDDFFQFMILICFKFNSPCVLYIY